MTPLMKQSKPVFTHDCDSCIYLGTYSDYYGSDVPKHIDCYWCNQGKQSATLASVIGRYSSEGQDYSAMHPPEAFASKQDYWHYARAWYLFAMLQATRMGLYKLESLPIK